MSLSDRIKAGPIQPTPGMPCSIGHALATLPEEESKALQAMLYELNWNATQIWEAMKAEGYTVGRQSINRHRGEKCRCFKDAA